MNGPEYMLPRMKQMREEKGYSTNEISRQMNISTQRYTAYERGLHKFPLEVLIKLAVIYDVSVDYLVGITDQREPHSRKKSG